MTASEELKELVEELKCDMCGKYLSCSPVLLSTRGENVCGRCIAPPNTESTYTRNEIYEKVAAQILFPCMNKNIGCLENLPMQLMKCHEEQCSFNATSVPCPTSITTLDTVCSWTGTVENLEAHYQTAHNNMIIYHPYTVKLDFCGETSSSLIMMLYGFAFLIQIKYVNGKLWQNVHLLGHTRLDKIFMYCMKFTNVNSCVEITKKVGNSDNFIIDEEKFIDFKIILDEFDDIDFKLR